jgi:transposase
MPAEEMAELEAEYDAAVAEGLASNPLLPKPAGRRGKAARGKAGAIAERLAQRKDNFLLFLRDFRVPFDNNQAERDIRVAKLKQKVSGCLRTKQGADDFAAVMSFTSTIGECRTNCVNE